MKFEPFEIDKDEKDYGYMYGKRSEDGKYDIMVGVVMYGYRVYVRTANNRVTFLKDLCGGADVKQVKTLYSWVETHLSKDKPIPRLLKEIPVLHVKPFINDLDFIIAFNNLMVGQKLIPNNITQQGLEEGRRRTFEKYT